MGGDNALIDSLFSIVVVMLSYVDLMFLVFLCCSSSVPAEKRRKRAKWLLEDAIPNVSFVTSLRHQPDNMTFLVWLKTVLLLLLLL